MQLRPFTIVIDQLTLSSFSLYRGASRLLI